MDEKFTNEYSKTSSGSVLDQQLIHMSQSLRNYKSFWIELPEQICQSKGISTSKDNTCWTGTSLSQDGR